MSAAMKIERRLTATQMTKETRGAKLPLRKQIRTTYSFLRRAVVKSTNIAFSTASSSASNTGNNDRLEEKRMSYKKKSSRLKRSIKAMMPLKQLKRRSRQRDALILQDSFDSFYVSLLQSILQPIGKSETTDVVSKEDMISHAQAVFKIDIATHEKCLGEAMLRKPKQTILKINVVEAKGIKAMDPNGRSDPYCIISLVRPSHSPKASPKNSPKLINKHKERRQSSIVNSDVMRTKVKYATLEPKWHEEFEFHTADLAKEELNLYMWDHDVEDSVWDGVKHLDNDHKLAGLRNIFRQIRQTVEYGKPIDDFLGKIQLPLREVPSLGLDKWFKLQKQSRSIIPVTGQIRLRMQLAVKENAEIGETSDNSERYYMLAKEVYKYNAENSNAIKYHTGPWNGIVETKSQIVLDQYAIQHCVCKVSQSLMHLCILLEWHMHGGVVETTLRNAISQVDMAVFAMQMPQGSFDMTDRPVLSRYEAALLEQCISMYIDVALHDIHDVGPQLFPPMKPDDSELDSIDTKYHLDLIHSLIGLKAWYGNGAALKGKVINKLIDVIKTTGKKWLSEKLENILSEDKGTFQPSQMVVVMKSLKDVTEELNTLCAVNQNMRSSLAGGFDMNYYKLVCRIIDSHLSPKIQAVMKKLDEYQLRYQRYPINISESSSASLACYLAVKKIIKSMSECVKESDELDLSGHSTWFQGALIFWLQTFKWECDRRVRKALEMDPNVMLVDSLVKFSISSVDVLTCFQKITQEWIDIDYDDPDSACVAVTKITELICDGARLYADNLHNTLHENGFYDKDSPQFDIKEKLCITLNNIDHVRQYLEQLSGLLKWEETVGRLVTKHSNQSAGTKTLHTLKRLVKSANSDVLNKSDLLVRKMTERMSEEMTKSMECLFHRGVVCIDPVMEYLDGKMEKLYKTLSPPIYPRVVNELWNTLLRTSGNHLEVGAPPDYYQTLDKHLGALEKFFGRDLGLSEMKVKNYQYHHVKNQLTLNSMSSEDLVCEYYQSMAENVSTPDAYFGHLAIKIGYMEETRGNITIFVKVVNAVDLPGLDKNGLSDPFVILELCPDTIFTHSKIQKTKVVEQNLCPKFNQVFEFPGLPKEVLDTRGAVLSMTVVSQNSIWADSFAGEVFMHMKSAREVPVTQSIEMCPAVMLPLKRPTETDGPLQILGSRGKWDKVAKKFAAKRQKIISNKPTRTDRKSTRGAGFREAGLLAYFTRLTT
uniref:BAI1-associated protein 3-like n=1 Tax=Saccoglossus kowalevskii TaxID=10224 RepID=A0ABM0MM60_SACKO|nr:PREDICTED: BAI1-associated protein 3-like [Saccoglossus kowalevskii]